MPMTREEAEKKVARLREMARDERRMMPSFRRAGQVAAALSCEHYAKQFEAQADALAATLKEPSHAD